MEQRTTEELLERRQAIASEIETDGADLDALETETRAINAELERRQSEELKKIELRKAVAEGEGNTIEKIEERKPTMEIKEIRSSKEYMNAWVEGIKKDNYTECRRILTENTELGTETDGIVPVPTYVEDRMRALFADNAILNRIRKTYYKGNLKVGFEVSSTGAAIHHEGDEEIADEELIIGTVSLIPGMLKKSIAVSDEVMDMRGETFLDFLFDEFTNKIEELLCSGVLGMIIGAPDTSTLTEVGVPVVEASAVTLDIVAQALAQITATGANPVLIMNRGTYAAFRSAQLNANYAVDPFEGLPIYYSANLPAVGDAEAGDTWLIVADLNAVQANFPNGDEVKFVYDPYTLAKSDLVQITGRLYVAIGLTAPGYCCKVAVEE